MSTAVSLLRRICDELGLTVQEELRASPHPVPLSSRLATSDLAWASVAAVAFAAGCSPAALSSARIATAYRSDRFLTIDGTAPSVWSPVSGFWRTNDGWVRTHGNYPHHAAALRAGLHLGSDADASLVRSSLEDRTTAEAVNSITTAGGLVVEVRQENPAVDQAFREHPILEITPTEQSLRTPRSLSGMRVLDLTRVIAGPVCTRTLALLGTDVLRIDPPSLPEPEWQHFDTGHGKRSALLDARSTRMRELLERADAVVLGYRPAALQRLGLTAELLREQYPALVVAELSAWGAAAPERAGFDSLVQAESGIAMIESHDGHSPGALPAQALDHSAGYLLAAALTSLLQRRTDDGRGGLVRVSLRRIAAELLGLPRLAEPQVYPDFEVGPHLQRFDVEGKTLVTARPALPLYEFAAPHLWGADQPAW